MPKGAWEMHRMFWPVAGSIVLLAIGWAWLTPAVPATADPDHLLYLDTIAAMRAGQGYYEAMAGSLVDLYGGWPGSPLAFRLPTAFLVLELVPPAAVWPVWVAVVAIGSGLVAARMSRPWAGLFVTVWLLAMGMPLLATGPHAQWAVIEFWTLPAALLAVWRYESGDDRGAAAAATVAALLRELALPLLLFGLGATWRDPERRWPWILGLSTWVVAIGTHLYRAAAWTVDAGAEPRLIGSGHRWSVVEMATVGGGWWLFGVWLLGAAVVIARRRWMLALLVGLPLLGVLVDRDYWGILIVPAVVVAAFDLPLDRLHGAIRRARHGRVTP